MWELGDPLATGIWSEDRHSCGNKSWWVWGELLAVSVRAKLNCLTLHRCCRTGWLGIKIIRHGDCPATRPGGCDQKPEFSFKYSFIIFIFWNTNSTGHFLRLWIPLFSIFTMILWDQYYRIHFTIKIKVRLRNERSLTHGHTYGDARNTVCIQDHLTMSVWQRQCGLKANSAWLHLDSLSGMGWETTAQIWPESTWEVRAM